ncbi:putative C-_U-editing enzyme APOBEC-4 [Lepisosteus oculatus]|uniref:putative C->U-editing enzyme APOBEC-4 n=1 Tax=Lepisosteus oculatus TaxID=7918 RepID=UPI00371DEA57
MAGWGQNCVPFAPCWVSDAQGCPQCPYHIRTGEEARVPYSQFYEAFGFPYGPTLPNTHLLFYELRTATGALVQKGQASSCPLYHLHPEALLFDTDGYLCSVLSVYDNVSYVTLYSNYTPCEEPPGHCASALTHFLQAHPALRLDLLFSQLYHTEDWHPYGSANRQALRALGALWPRLTLSPISGGWWLSLLRKFVWGVPPDTSRRPFQPGRAALDWHNAYQISAITGVTPAFLDLYPEMEAPPEVPRAPPLPPPVLQHSALGRRLYFPPPCLSFPYPGAPSYPRRPLALPRPRHVVRHVRLPPPAPSRGSPLPPGRPVEVVVVKEREVAEGSGQSGDGRRSQGRPSRR